VSDEQQQPDAVGPNWYVLTLGLPTPECVTPLVPGVTLCPLPHRLTVFDLAAAASMGFQEGIAVGHLAPLCAVEIESAADAATVPGYDALNRAWLITALLVLRGHWQCMSIAASNYSWTRLRAKPQPSAHLEPNQYSNLRTVTDLAGYRATLLDFRLKLLSLPQPPPSDICNDDIQWISAHFATFNELCHRSESFRLALGCCIDWRYQDEQRSAVARLWQGIESLLAIKMELSYRISMTAAAITVARGPERTEAYKAIKKLYDVRSKAVHGEPIPDEKLGRGVQDSFELLRDLLVACIDRGDTFSKDDLLRVVLE
jgi:hypothetical protein